MLKLCALALRPVVGELCQRLLGGAPSSSGGELRRWLADQFGDASRRLPEAFRRSTDRAWRSLEVALAGESLWSRLVSRGEDLAFRQQVRQFLDAASLPGLTSEFRQRCLAELQSARSSGMVPGMLPDPDGLAQAAFELSRFAPAQWIEAEWQLVSEQGSLFRSAGHRHLAELIESRPVRGGPPLLTLAVRYFFGREVESQPSLLQGLTCGRIEQLGDALQSGLDGLAQALEAHETQLTGILGLLTELRSEVLDLRVEQHRQGQEQQAIYEAVVRIGEKLDQLHERSSRPSDSLSIHSDRELEMVRQVIARYRSLPEEQRERLPALLDAIGKLELATGDFQAARQDFHTVSRLVHDPAARATAHTQAFQAALEQRQWEQALEEYRRAVTLGGSTFSLLPHKQYEPLQILGAGGFGIVFLCRNRYSGAELVIKAMRADELERNLNEVFREAAVLEQLHHPTIIRLRDCGLVEDDPSRAYLMMDYFRADTLEQLVEQQGPLGAADCRAIAAQMAEGLLTAHHQGILHRDVKPGNVLVRRTEGQGWAVKLIDFGLAMRDRAGAGARTTAGSQFRTVRGHSISGTIKFAAPEQLGQLPGVPVSARSDLYGFAATCCYALFQTPRPTRKHWRQLNDDPLYELLDDCLAENPQDRPASFEEVLSRLSSGEVPNRMSEPSPSPPAELVIPIGPEPVASSAPPLALAYPVYPRALYSYYPGGFQGIGGHLLRRATPTIAPTRSAPQAAEPPPQKSWLERVFRHFFD